MRNASVLLLLLLLSALSPFPTYASKFRPPVTRQAQSTATDSTPRFLGSYVQQQDVPALCAQEQQFGVRFTWIAIPWYAVEPTRGRFIWTYSDPIVQAARACGEDIGVHILSRSTWATLAPPSGSPPGALISMPPIDMADYYTFVYQLASHYRGMVSVYSIENEAHASINWPSSPDSYFQILATGYRAVHQADPNAQVEDSGLSSSALGLLVANDMLASGDSQGTLSYWANYFSVFDTELSSAKSVQDIQATLAQPEAQRTLHWSDLLYANSIYFDIQQIHYFAPWNSLQQATDWVHRQLIAHGGDKPLDFWETGYGWDDPSTLDTQLQAREQIKLFTMALGGGALRVTQFQFTDYAASIGHPGLVTSAGPQPPAHSFHLLAQKLNGATAPRRLDMGPSVWAYQFDTPTGRLYVAWSGGTQSVSLPLTSPMVTVTDFAGTQRTANSRSIVLSDSPVVVQPTAGILFLPMLQRP